jgi:hypothetical protein
MPSLSFRDPAPLSHHEELWEPPSVELSAPLRVPPRGLPSPATVYPWLLHHKLRTSALHLYVLSSAAIDLWVSLPSPSTSYRAMPPWGALPSELPFPLTLPRAARVL